MSAPASPDRAGSPAKAAGRPAPLLGDDFLGGRPYVHPDGTDVRFADDRWPLETDPLTAVRFDDLPLWLRGPAKRYLAIGWLDEGKSIGWLTGAVSALRYWARLLGDLAGATLRDLTPDHAHKVHAALAAEAELARAALEEAERVKGGPLDARERKKAIRAAGGRVKIDAYVGHINGVCQTMRERLQWEIHFHLGRVKTDFARGPWSADESKVLSDAQHDALVRVLRREVRRYTHARELIARLLGRADYGALARALAAEGGGWATGGRSAANGRIGRPINQEYARFVLDCYFGLHGKPMHSNVQLCPVLNLSPRSFANVGRQAKKYLAQYMPEAEVAAVCKLREKIMYRKVAVQGPDPVREELLARLAARGVGVAQDEVVERGAVERPLPDVSADREAFEAYCGLRDGVPWPLARVGELYGYETARMTVERIEKRLALLLGPKDAARVLALRHALDTLHGHAIKASAVMLQMAAARRVSGLLTIQAEPRVETHALHGTITCVVHFRAGKGWGDTGVDDPVPCPGRLGALATEAIDTAQRLTAPLRARAAESERDLLFLTGGVSGSHHQVVALSEATLTTYVFSEDPTRNGGILRRYAGRLVGFGGFSLHHARHTNATHMNEAGASMQTIARYLGHNFTATNTEQAAVFYVAGGTDGARQVVVVELERGAGTGYLFDALGRVAVEGMGEEFKRTNPHAARLSAELTLEEALARIRDSDIIQPVPHTVEDALAALKGGFVLTPTVWGACLLQAEDGPCPAGGHDCTVGINPEHPRVREGKGCCYQVQMPHGAEQLEHDADVLRAQLGALDGVAEEAQWRSKLSAELAIKEIQLETARALDRGMSGAA